MADSPEEIKKHIKLYWVIGGALFVCTGVTIALRLVPFFDVGPLGVTSGDIFLGLCVAVFKSCLVALIFMHLNHERGLIYKMLLFTLAFSVSLMGLTLFAMNDPIHPRSDYIAKDLIIEDDHSLGHATAHEDGHGESDHSEKPEKH